MVETLQRRKQVAWEQIESEQDVFIDILSRLPAQSICSLQTTSKYWYGSIRTKCFAMKQFNRSRESPGFIACLTKDSTMELYSMKRGSFRLSYVNKIDPSERKDKRCMRLVSSFNGLICCINYFCHEDAEDELWDLQIWICNPFTGEALLLPQGRPSYEFVPIVGVAYYSDTTDYKVYRIFCAGKKSHEERVAYECEVYSSDTGSWQNIGPVPCLSMDYHCIPFGTGHVFIGGKVYWISSLDGPGEILSVDLSGRFGVLPLPPYPDGLREEDAITEASYLVNLNGALSMVILHPGYMDIWVWQEANTWVLDYVGYMPVTDDDLVLSMTSSENKIICLTTTHWYSFDVEAVIWRKKRVKDADQFLNPCVLPFTESVLPCNGGMML